MIEIVTGDDELIPITLKKNGLTFSISSLATVKIAIIDKAHTAILCGPFTLSHTEAGSDWPNSLIIGKIPGLSSKSLTAQLAGLEIEVNDGGKKTWFVDAKLVKGLIQ